MRTICSSMLAFLMQGWLAVHAQPQAQTGPASSAVPNGNWTRPSTRRLFFFSSDSNGVARPAMFARPAQAPASVGLFRPFSFTGTPARNFSHQGLRSPFTGLRPLPTPSLRIRWDFVRPKNSKLFYFSKP